MIDETEQVIAEVRAQILDFKKRSISADSIYEFLLHFDEIYRECTDVEKKKFLQSFVDHIEIYPERRKDGNWIKNILFNFSIPVVREDEELARIGGISMENSTLSNVDLPLEKLPTHETVVLLGDKRVDGHIKIDVDVEKLDNTGGRATYAEIKEKYGYSISSLYIAQVKDKVGLEKRDNYNHGTGKTARVPQCTPEKEEAIMNAFRHLR